MFNRNIVQSSIEALVLTPCSIYDFEQVLGILEDLVTLTPPRKGIFSRRKTVAA